MYELLISIIRMFNLALYMYITDRLLCLCQEHGCNAMLYLLFLFCVCLYLVFVLLLLCLSFVYIDNFSVHMVIMRASWKTRYCMYSHSYICIC